MKLDIQDLPIDALIARERNPNKMTSEQFDLLVAAIKRVGCVQPVLVRALPPMDELSPKARETALMLEEGWEIIDGFHRINACKQAGLSHVPAVIIESDEQMAAALQLGLNRMRGEVSLNAAVVELQLLEGSVYTELCGFAPDEIEALLAQDTGIDIEEALEGASANVPEERVEPGGSITLEIPGFTDAKELRAAKRALKKAGAGNLRVGLMRILGELQPTPKPKKRTKDGTALQS